MPNPYDQSLEGLFKVYGNWNPMAYMRGADMLDQGAKYNDMQSNELALKNDRYKQMTPLEVQHQGLLNQEKEAGLPGLWADSNMKVDKATLSRATLDDQYNQLIRDFKEKASKQDYDELGRVGNTYAQTGEMLKGIPGMMTHARAKELLKQNYLPEFDQIPPHLLGAAISSIGRDMMDAQPKLYGDLLKQNDRQAFLAAENDKKEALARELAVYKSTLAQNLAKIKSSQDPKTLEAAIAQLKRDQQRESDPDRKKIIGDQVQELFNMKWEIDQNKATASAAGKVDPGAVAGLPTTPVRPAPNVGNPGGTPPAPPASQATDQKELFTKAFGAYEPDKYEYRIGPNGVPQRRKK